MKRIEERAWAVINSMNETTKVLAAAVGIILFCYALVYTACVIALLLDSKA